MIPDRRPGRGSRWARRTRAGRVVCDSARDRHALLLAAGQLTRIRARLVREADEREHPEPFADLVAVLPTHLERVGDVLVRGAVGSSLKPWKTHATLRRSIGTRERLSRARSRPPTMMRPRVGSAP